LAPLTPSGQKTELVYSTAPDPHGGVAMNVTLKLQFTGIDHNHTQRTDLGLACSTEEKK